LKSASAANSTTATNFQDVPYAAETTKETKNASKDFVGGTDGFQSSIPRSHAAYVTRART